MSAKDTKDDKEPPCTPGRTEIRRRINRLIELRHEYRQHDKSLPIRTRREAFMMLRAALTAPPFQSH
jgi:hypothetical protein